MKKLMGIICISVLVAGCATATKIPLPNNQEGMAIECDKPAKCYKKAQEVCPSGFNLVDKSSRNEGGFVNGIGALGEKQTLIIQCKSVAQ